MVRRSQGKGKSLSSSSGVGSRSISAARTKSLIGQRGPGSPGLLGGLLARAGVADGPLPPQMPAGVRQMAPERVQAAMKVVEDWVAGRDEGGDLKP